MQNLIRLYRCLSPRQIRTRLNSSVEGGKEASPLRRLLDDASSFGEAETEAAEPELRWATQPYARRPSAERPVVKRVDPSETSVLLFPDEGSCRVGMGRRLCEVPAAKELYEFASSVVGWDVWRVCTEGPAKELCARSGTAVLVTSLGAVERVRDERPGALERVRAAAGYGGGELGALVWAGALPLERALRLAELQTAAVRAALAERPGGSLALWLAPDANIGHALLRAREHALERGVAAPVCAVAAYVRAGARVVAGDEVALRYLEREGAKFGVKRTARLPAPAPAALHCALMARAEDAMREALRSVEVRAPRVATWCGAEARPYRDARDVRRGLARLVSRPLRWEQTLHALYARRRGEQFPLTLALGPAHELRATLRHVNARAWDTSLEIDV